MGTGGLLFYLDGVEKVSNATTQGMNGNTEMIILGAENSDSETSVANATKNYFNGKIDELRISSTRRYTTGFTPSAVAFTDDADTLGLWHFDEASGSVTHDASDTITHAMVQTFASDAAFDTGDPKYGAQALCHAGSANDFGRINHETEMEVSAFTVDMWIKIKDDNLDGMIWHKGGASTEGGLEIRYASSFKGAEVTYYGASTSRILTSATDSLPKDVWVHIGVTADANYVKLHINGVEVDSETLTGDFANVWTNNKDDIYWRRRYDGTSGLGTEYGKFCYDDMRISDTVLTFGPSGIREISSLVKI
jgi:hypothetical protein